jgi:hypothetical protein
MPLNSKTNSKNSRQMALLIIIPFLPYLPRSHINHYPSPSKLTCASIKTSTDKCCSPPINPTTSLTTQTFAPSTLSMEQLSINVLELHHFPSTTLSCQRLRSHLKSLKAPLPLKTHATISLTLTSSSQ